MWLYPAEREYSRGVREEAEQDGASPSGAPP
jgi:hypothetical protein